jgi:hypothetical protein
MSTEKKTGIELIAEERARQISKEGWDAGHDDEHDEGELARAAACYALPYSIREWAGRMAGTYRSNLWPWDSKWWKPCPDDRIRELTKAGALIAAEIDRLNRQSL